MSTTLSNTDICGLRIKTFNLKSLLPSIYAYDPYVCTFSLITTFIKNQLYVRCFFPYAEDAHHLSPQETRNLMREIKYLIWCIVGCWI